MKNIIYVFRLVKTNAKQYYYLAITEKLLALLKYYTVIYINKVLFNLLASTLQNKDNIKLSITGIVISLMCSVLVSWLFGLISAYLGNRIAISQFEYGKIMRTKINHMISQLDLKDFDDPTNLDKIRQSIRDSEAVSTVFRETLNLFSSIISFIITFIIVSKMGILFTFFVLVSALPSYFINKNINMNNYSNEKENVRSERMIDYTLGLYYNRAAFKELKLFDFERMLNQKFQNSSNDINKKKEMLLKKNMRKRMGLFSYSSLVSLVINFYICFKVFQKGFYIGDYSYYVSLSNNLTDSVTGLFSSFTSLSLGNIKIKNFRDFMEKEAPVFLGDDIIDDCSELDFVFDRVSFVYPNTNVKVLNNVSFTIKKGEIVSFVGLNGSGKSTLLSLLLRLYEPTEGNIYLNGKNIRDYDIQSYRKLFSCMIQENIVYSYSLKDNIILSDIDKQLNEQQLKELLNSWEILSDKSLELNQYMDKTFDDNGEVLSKGQSQSLQLARVVFREAEIYAFDEPTAALDAFTEAKLISKIISNLKGKTIVLVSHRLSNLVCSDKIIVIENGQIAEMGSHNELMDNKKLYYDMFELQKTKYCD